MDLLDWIRASVSGIPFPAVLEEGVLRQALRVFERNSPMDGSDHSPAGRSYSECYGDGLSLHPVLDHVAHYFHFHILFVGADSVGLPAELLRQ
jgi:hypothetical protein